MFNSNEKYFSISERCGRNHQIKFCLRPPKRHLCTWELCYETLIFRQDNLQLELPDKITKKV